MPPTEDEKPSTSSQSGHSAVTGLPARPPRPKGRPAFALVILILAAVLIGVLWWVNHQQSAHGSMPGAGPGGSGGRGRFAGGGPLPVAARAAVSGKIDIYLDGLGTVTPLANVVVQTQISGKIVDVAFTEGQMVAKGDPLVTIDPRPYQVALQQAQGQLLQAQAQLKEAQLDLARYQTLSEQDSIATQQVDAQKALVQQDQGLVQTDEAAVANATLNLAYCHITAPISGRVGLRQVDAGNYVTPSLSTGLVVITQLKPISVIFTLPEDSVPSVSARLRTGTPIPVFAYDRSNTDRLATGTLTTIDNQVDMSTGTFRLRATFPNDDGSLFPNQFVNIRMLLDVLADATVIPTSAIEHGQQGDYVYVVKPDNTVTARTVTLGPAEGERVAIDDGLDVGEKVVVDGADKLKEGTKVMIQRPGGGNGTRKWQPGGTGDPGGAGGGGAHQ